MKKKNLFALALMLMAAVMLTFTACGKDDDDDDNDDDNVPAGVIGKWLSEGANVAPLLAAAPLNIVRVEAEFKADNTYNVKARTSEGVEIPFTGVFTQTKSSVGNFWTIVLEQSVPTAVRSEGIFEVVVVANQPRTMTYEVVQTNPALGTAPTPEGGFGSTSGGALGQLNVQKYVEVLP